MTPKRKFSEGYYNDKITRENEMQLTTGLSQLFID